jgi:hypothetical protein
MPHMPSRTKSKNRVLPRLSRSDFALLKPHLVPADLPVGTHLETGKTRIDNVYFMEGGFASSSLTDANAASRSASSAGKA